MHPALKMGFSLLAIQYCLIQGAAGAGLKPLKPGQYNIGHIQQICLKNDSTWYGTTFNFGGHWVNFPATLDRVVGAIYGNYQIQDHRHGFGNSAITFSKPAKNTSIGANWYDWFDDLSYEAYVTEQLVEFVKTDCDPPFTGQNTKAATG